MKRILLTLLGIVLVLGLFGAAGYAGYRFGYAQGRQATVNGDSARPDPALRPFHDLNPRGMPGFGMDRRFERGLGPGQSPMMGFGFFSPLMWLGRIAVLGLIVLFIYWLFTRSGWRLTRAAPTTETQPNSAEPEAQG